MTGGMTNNMLGWLIKAATKQPYSINFVKGQLKIVTTFEENVAQHKDA